MILESENAVKAYRKLMGATNPKDAEENTLRKLFEFQLIRILFMAQIDRKCKKRN